MNRRPTCPACQRANSEVLARIGVAEQHANYAPNNADYQNRLTLAAGIDHYCMLKCRHCALEYSQPMLNPGEQWYELAYNSLSLYPRSRWEFKALLEASYQSDTILEIGCGDGVLLEMLQKRGVAAVGLDFSNTSIRACNEKGLQAYPYEIGKEGQIPGGFQASRIVAFHLLEHLSNPNDLFAFAGRAARADTTLWIAVPSDRRPSRNFKERDCLDEPPHHMTRWTASSLREIGKRNGWIMCRFSYEPIGMKTLAWHFAIRSNAYVYARGRNLLRNSNIERFWRWMLYPTALWATLRAKPTSGFSMLAEFSRDQNL
jgi:SAM-dependent methyltransferase